MTMDQKHIIKRIEAELAFIEYNNTKGCPDPGNGGCIGRHCTVCACREIRGHLVDLKKNWS